MDLHTCLKRNLPREEPFMKPPKWLSVSLLGIGIFYILSKHGSGNRDVIKDYFNINSTYSTFQFEPNINTSLRHTFLVYILSAPANFDRRLAIRETWVNKFLIRRFPLHHFNVEHMFVVGGLKYLDKKTVTQLEDEHDIYHDILAIDDLEDTYYNLSRKTLLTMQWISSKCNMSNVDFLLKVDDDVLLNIYFILNVAWFEIKRELPRPAHFIVCHPLSPRAARTGGKWAEDDDAFSGEYPAYCQGGAYGYSSRTFQLILDNLDSTPILRNEDAMITGVALEKYTDIVRYHYPVDRVIPTNDRKHRLNYIPSSKPYDGLDGLTYDRNAICSRDSRPCLGQLFAMVYAHKAPIEMWREAFSHMDDAYLIHNRTVKEMVEIRNRTRIVHK